MNPQISKIKSKIMALYVLTFILGVSFDANAQFNLRDYSPSRLWQRLTKKSPVQTAVAGVMMGNTQVQVVGLGDYADVFSQGKFFADAVVAAHGRNGYVQDRGHVFQLSQLHGNQNAFSDFQKITLPMRESSPDSRLPFGTNIMTDATGSFSHVVHVVIQGALAQESFRIVRDGIYGALKIAGQNKNIKTVLIPAVEFDARLTSAQLAAAITAGISMAQNDGASFEKIILDVIDLKQKEPIEFAVAVSELLKSASIPEYLKYVPAGELSPEKGNFHYEWNFSSRFEGSKGEIEIVGLSRIDLVSVSGTRGVGPYRDYVDVIPLRHGEDVSHLKRVAARIWKSSRTITDQFEKSGSRTESYLHYLPARPYTGFLANDVATALFEIFWSVRGTFPNLVFKMTDKQFLGFELKTQMDIDAVREGFNQFMQKLAEEKIIAGKINLAIDSEAILKVELPKYKNLADRYYLRISNEARGIKACRSVVL